VVKSLLENDGLVPGDAADGEISYAGTAGGKRELLEHGEQPRKHFLFLKAGKPDA
jgi:DNA-binding PadR family transcriptional regulator